MINPWRKPPALLSDLADKILSQPGMECYTMALNKHWNKSFNDKKTLALTLGKSEGFKIAYFDGKLGTNPRWAYFAYKEYGDPLAAPYNYDGNLTRYRMATLKHIPSKYMIATLINATLLSFNFQLFPIVTTTAYFLVAHFATLALLYKGDICTNVNNLFFKLTIFSIVSNIVPRVLSTDGICEFLLVLPSIFYLIFIIRFKREVFNSFNIWSIP